MEKQIDDLLTDFQNSLSNESVQDQIKEKLKMIESEINKLEEEEQEEEEEKEEKKQNKKVEVNKLKLFGFYKYKLAKIVIKSGKFPCKKYENHQKKYQEDYKEVSQSTLKQSNRKQEEVSYQKDDENYKKQEKKYYLVIGNKETGKSSFIKKVIQNQDEQISNKKDSDTQECQLLDKFIDTPGINDTQNISRYEIMLKITEFLKYEQIKLNDLFIILVQNEQLKSFRILREFSYAYFLYELFEGKITSQQVQKLVEEYFQSSYLLNWSETGFDVIQDDFADKRKQIFLHKDKASNYFDYIYAYHIRLLTFFDRQEEQILQEYDDHKVEFLKEQIWSELDKEEKCYAYNEYISDQKNKLLDKIDEIQRLQYKNNYLTSNQECEDILLIGKSQVGKSSLIEQLTDLKGLRGLGQYSETSVCSAYVVNQNNISYRFIDTPGYDGTENSQTIFHNFKIIADYLKRNHILEFKVLLMIQKDKERRDTTLRVLNQFFFFVQYIFEQDVSFIDNNYLDNLLLGEQNSDRNKMLLKDKILQVFRSSSDDCQVDDEFLQYTFFKSNYITQKGKKIIIKQQEDIKQKNELFEKISNIDFVSIEDKVVFRIKRMLLGSIISSSQEFHDKFKEIAESYKTISEIKKKLIHSHTKQNQIAIKMQQSENKDLINQKREIEKQLKKAQFNVIGNIYKQSNQINELKYEERIKNDALKHFIPLQYTPVLFEIDDQQPRSVLISRKQHYYSLLAHQLSSFVDLKKESHRKKLEDLAEIKLLQEISYYSIEHSKFIENNYQNNFQENIQTLNNLSQKFDTIFAQGIQFHSQFKYLNTTISQLSRSAHTISGQDTFQMLKTNNKKYELYLFKSFTLGLGFFGYEKKNINTYIYSIIAGISMIAAQMWQNYNEKNEQKKYYFYIGQFLETIIDDVNANQQLRYFEKAQLLKGHFNLNNYSQLCETNIWNDMLKKLQKDNFDQNKQVLKQLFKKDQNQDLQDEITKYIVNNYILSKISLTSDIKQYDGEQNKMYLERTIYRIEVRITINKPIRKGQNEVEFKIK
ncbi:hypothetical protein ABPG74_019949 [Tetrahymena malaccensis]